MSMHTPGPWSVAPNESEVWTVLDADGYPPTIAETIVAPGESAQEIRANANLIAAAPDLLEALQDAQAVLGEMIEDLCPDGDGAAERAIAQAEKAIAKAKGDE